MKIAIVKLSALGDIIHAMVALQFIKDFYPDIEIDWIVDEHFKEVLINNPHIRNIHTVLIKKAKKKKSLLLLLKELRKLQKLKKYDLVIDSQGLIKSAILAKMIPAKKITGFDRHSIRESFASIFYNQKISIAYNENTIDRNIAVFCKPLNISLSSEEIIDKRPFIFSKHQIRLIDKPYIVFVIGSTWESRNYPKEKFVEIANSLNKKCVVIWGNMKEKQKADWMEKKSSFIEVAPELSLDELKQLINYSLLLIGNDTGPSHIAWGMNKPSIILFGPTPINRVYETKINRVLKSNSKVDHFNINRDDFSIKDIKVSDIVEISQELLRLN